MSKIKDLTGFKFCKLTVIRHIGLFKGYHWWECKCDCGNIIKSNASRLNFGQAKSCGCRQKEFAKNMCISRSTHNMRNTRLYTIWRAIRQRCLYKRSISYPFYGGRGIKICEEWNDFNNFKEWAILSCYSDELSIDRKNVNGNYCPENCRWFTPTQQANNRRNSMPISFNGETLSIHQWSIRFNIKVPTLKNRLNNNWPLEKAFLTIPNPANRK